MLISLKVNNCFIYNAETEFTMRSDMRNKHFSCNVISVNSTNVLKSAIIIGSNNAGKTIFVRCLDTVRSIMLNEGKRMVPNIFNDDKKCEFAISFCDNSFEYSFELKYDYSKNEYIFEKFSKITYDIHKNKKETIILLRDTQNMEYVCNTEDKEEKNVVISAMKVIAKNNLLIYLLDTSQFSACTAAVTSLQSPTSPELNNKAEVFYNDENRESLTVPITEIKKYSAKPEYQLTVREEIYLDSMLDLF